ncbi:asparagine synthase (glutamine-hydrolyzing) [bacterium]|nr:asparagine synthase (glutamine-hydrolyzing) [bacterium]
MCGITGFLDLQPSTSAEELTATIERMVAMLVHRGPDDRGIWVDAAAGIALGQRRLSILDLSPAGHQPMPSHDGRLWLVYNGEIYNHEELRRDLGHLGFAFRGTSDTETLVEAIRVWGVPATLQRCRGIFALAVYDTVTRELTLARDHLGIKPLYYGQQGRSLLFGSELKALRAHPDFQGEINRQVLPQYLRHNYIPGPYSIYRGIQKLPAGTYCVFRSDKVQPVPQPYWSMTEHALAGAQQPLNGTIHDITNRLESELIRAVGEQMLADVPLGAFLSGGIDSSLVVALMQRQSSQPVKTFSIGFELADYNEAPFAAEIAQHLKTDHTEHYVSAREALDVIPLLPTMFDEPFADSSQIPTYLVSKLARQQVTVALSGDGGDELFCGYLRYFAPLFGLRGGLLPQAIRQPASWGARVAAGWMPSAKWRKFLSRASQFLGDADPDQRYLRGMSHWALNDGVVLGNPQPVDTAFLHPDQWPNFPSPQQRWMWLDTLNYLPDDILVKVDRASMAVSLEARVPLLDPQVVELAWQIPHGLKAQGWSGKRILKDVLAKYVPRPLFERPKKGFGVPIAEWLRGPLKDWGAALLDASRLRNEGWFDAGIIQRTWEEHQSGRNDRAYLLWDILMFQAWLDASRSI